MKRSTSVFSISSGALLRSHRVPSALRARCSVLVLAGLGLLTAGPAAMAQATGRVLPTNTLPVLRGVVGGQVVVNAPVRGAAVPQMTIDQASRRAVLDWRSFNISSDAEVLFRHQQGSGASTLNRIYDANPSIIQGRLTSAGPVGADGRPGAGGQVLLINQNGILFDRGSQVNTQSLIASTLNLSMSNSQFCGGDLVACNGGAALSVGGLTAPAFEGGYDELGNWLPARPGAPRAGTIAIGNSGAGTAPVPLLTAGAGGSIVLIASGIDHEAGLIASPDGQVVLAAGKKAYLAVSDDSTDITLRGYRVEVEAAKDGPGLNLTNLVRNAADITADRGNVTLAALAINQEGRISAKTAVQRNGSIFLSARTKDGAEAGTLRLAVGSVTEVVPDSSDPATLPDSVSYAPYRGVIRAEAGLIESRGTVQAAGGRIGLEASNLADPSSARVYLGDGSLTSVAGSWADVDTEKNLATFRVTSNELKNSPDQKAGFLLGKTVTVDLREGNNLLALDGYRDAVGRTVAEKAVVGGQLSIASTGSVIQRSQATIDASGGGFRYGGGRVATTNLLGNDGRIYNIATAPQARQYVGQLDRFQSTDKRWGVTTDVVNLTSTAGTFREAYVEGLAGGSVRIGSGAGLVLDGTLKGGVTVGPRQFAQAPQGASLSVGAGFQPLSLSNQDNPPSVAVYNAENQRIGNVLWRQQATDTLGTSFNAATTLTENQRDTVGLAAGQVFGAAQQTAEGRIEASFGSVEVNSDGRIAVPADVEIRSDVGASLTLRGPSLDIAGDIRLSAGTLTLAPQLLQTEPISSDLLSLNERTIVRSTATLSVAGAWLNQSGVGGAAVGEALPSGRRTAGSSVQSATNGGSIVLRTTDPEFQSRLERGAVLDVGGGAMLDSGRRIVGGRGGQLSLSNGIANQQTSDWQMAELRGDAVASGGTLTLNLNRAQLAPASAEGVLPSATTRFGADLFSDHGFANIAVNASNGIDVVEGTQIAVRQRNLVFDTAAAVALPSGGDLRSVASLQTLPPYQRASASLTLASDIGAVTVGEGARIATDAGGGISMVGGAALTIDGALVAPAGRISLSLRGSAVLDADPLRLGDKALVSAAGTFVQTPSDAGLVRGNVLGGGAVTLEARQAGIVAESGSRIDVSGIEHRVDFVSGDKTGAVQSQTVAGHAGTIVIKAQDSVRLDGTMVAAGTAEAAGGSFAIELTRPDRQTALPPAQRLVVSADGIDRAPVTGSTTSVLDATRLQAAGFDKLRLLSEDSIEFQGDTTLRFERGIRLDAPVIESRGGANTTLRGSTISLGQSLGVRTQQVDEVGRLVWTRDDTRPQAKSTPRSGSGLLVLDAGMVDFYGSPTLQGTATTRVISDGDVRFVGREVDFDGPQAIDPKMIYQYGSLDAAGSMEFHATQIYPATRSRFDVQAHGSGASLTVVGNGNAVGDVYSAAGALTLRAPVVVQSGIVRAPQGELNLVASQRLELRPGSLTSVSGDGLSVLYGSTLDGVQWRYIDGSLSSSNSNPRLLDAVSDQGKRLTMSAPVMSVAQGAAVDLRGGGNVLAVEFVPGNGGDSNVTNAADTFAIIPKSRLASTPYDSDLQFVSGARDPGTGFSLGNARDTALYDSVQIGAGGRVPAGEYVLLPARFALLPDAYLVQLQTGSVFRNLQVGQNAALATGEVVVAAHRSARGTSVRESQSVGVVVLPGSAVNRYSDFTLIGAQLFADDADKAGRLQPAAPWDAGSLGILDATTLSLGGSFLTNGVEQGVRSGRTAEIDITGPRIAIVDRVGSSTRPSGTLEIGSDTLSGLKASVLVGGTRTREEDGFRITTSAQRVSVANTAQAAVDVPELLITAREGIDIASGSLLRATGPATADAPVLHTEASGALLRLSTGAQATVDRGVSVSAATGDIDIAAGATLQAAGSLLLDATRATRSAGQLRAGGADGVGGAVSLSASRLSLGQTEGVATSTLGGLVLSNDDLARYAQLNALTLRAYDRIDFLGAAKVGSVALRQLVLDTPQLAAQTIGGASHATVSAAEVRLLNRSSARRDATGGSGQLAVAAQRLLVGEGEKASTGFGTVNLTAGAAIEVQGKGSLRTGGTLDLNTPTLRALAGANQRIAAVAADSVAPVYGDLHLATTATSSVPSASPATALGGRLSLEGHAVAIDTVVQARSGRVAVVAHGGDVALGARATIDAAGETKNFNGSVVAADGGKVALQAKDGAVTMAPEARVDVSAAALGGNAGQVQVVARNLAMAGSVAGHARESSRGGSVDVDVATLGDFSALNSLLDRGGFSEERQLRLREGDLVVAKGDTVDARLVTLTADKGRITVEGTVGRVTDAGGGRLGLHGGAGVQLAAGSRLLAAGTAVGARGGEVRVDTRSGTLAFEAGANIDVHAGDAGPQGSVVFGVLRDAVNATGNARLNGQVLRYSAAGLVARSLGVPGDAPASVDLEATRVYAGVAVPATMGTTQLAAWAADHQQFVASVASSTATANLRDETGALVGARVLGATEVQGSGALSIDSNWDLTNSAWRAAGLPGTLTVRAAGSLTLRSTLGAPGLPSSTNATTNNANNNINHAIVAGETWNIRLAAGADLGSSDALATVRDVKSGNLLMNGAAANLRTGSGRIDLAAAGDIRLDNVASSIYTAGRISAADTALNGNNRWAVDGGGISMVAGGAVRGPVGVPDLWITDWFRRLRQSSPSEFTLGGFATDWWSYRPRFQQGVGTLAGGDIDVRAGGDVADLLFALPTSGRTSTKSTVRQVEITGGGNLEVRAGGDVDGASFLISRGTGSIVAGGDIGRASAPQAYLMGVSSGNVPEQAQLTLAAGGAAVLGTVVNPTYLGLNGGTGAAGPSFHPTNAGSPSPSSIATTFFTYSANSAVGVSAKGGDVSLVGGLALDNDWRSITAFSPNNLPGSATTAFPASLALVAFEGDINGPGTFAQNRGQPNVIKTYPSASASVIAFAAGDIRNLGVEVSDLAPMALVTPATNVALARPTIASTTFFDTGSKVSADQKPLAAGRITQRTASLPFGLVEREAQAEGLQFDVQALNGSIVVYDTRSQLYLPARSRVRAGQDVVDVDLQLQNLAEGDVSEVRAVKGDITKRGGTGGIEVRGPGQLLVQAGGDIDLGAATVAVNGEIVGGLVATGDTRNPLLTTNRSARLTVIAGVDTDLDLGRMDTTYRRVLDVNRLSTDISSLFAQLDLEGETGRDAVLGATDIASLIQRNGVYSRFVGLDESAPEALAAYQKVLGQGSLPLGDSADASAARRLLSLLSREDDVARMASASSLRNLLAQLVSGGSKAVTLGSEALDSAAVAELSALADRYPKLFTGAVSRRMNGAQLTGTSPLVFDEMLTGIVAGFIPSTTQGGGNIFSFQTSIQTLGGSDIDLWTPSGNIVVGLTTPNANRPVGLLTNAGGAIRSVLTGDFNINQGKVLTAQGGDILLFSALGSIDAGRGAKTSLSTPAPQRRPILDAQGNQIGVQVVIPASATGSGIQTLTSDPDGLGPALTPRAGDIYLFAPAGKIDAGEAGIRSSGNILINAQVVLNASDIRSGGTSQGVPVATSGSLASSLASAGTNTAGTTNAGEEASNAASTAARAAAAAQLARPTILVVEILGFGDKNCKEQDKDCFAK